MSRSATTAPGTAGAPQQSSPTSPRHWAHRPERYDSCVVTAARPTVVCVLADQAGAEAAEARPDVRRSVLSGLPRAAATIVGCVFLFAIIAATGTELVGGEVRERATIGLTEESEWPFHDVHLAATASQLDDASLVTDVQAELGLPLDPDAVSLDRERRTGDGVLVVRADAATGAQAAALVNAVADKMVTGANLPVFVADRADGRAQRVGAASALAAGALVGLLVGLVAVPRRRVSRG